MLVAYIKAALFSSSDDSGHPLDKSYGFDDIDSKTLAKMRADVHGSAGSTTPPSNPSHGQCFSVDTGRSRSWLTGTDTAQVSGTATGPSLSTTLDEAADRLGNVNLYVHKGKIYSSP